MTPTDKVLFGIGLENGVHKVSDMLGRARAADEAGLDLVSDTDHPYFAEGVDAYAALGVRPGRDQPHHRRVIMTNLLSRPAPILARTVSGLSTISGGRVVLGLGAGGMSEEIIALGVPRLSPAAWVRQLEEAIVAVRALSDGGDPVIFDGVLPEAAHVRVTTAFNRILGLSGAVVESVEFGGDGVVVGVRPRARRLTCPCGRPTGARYDTSRRRWRHLDMGATKVLLEADIARVDCRRCGRVVTQMVPWGRPRARHSRDFGDVVA